jgi:hypothetical protein
LRAQDVIGAHTGGELPASAAIVVGGYHLHERPKPVAAADGFPLMKAALVPSLAEVSVPNSYSDGVLPATIQPSGAAAFAARDTSKANPRHNFFIADLPGFRGR